MPSRGGWSEVRRPLAALGCVCVLMAGCTAGGGEPVDTPPTLASLPMPTPANSPTPENPTTSAAARGRGALAYGLDGDIYVADSDGSNAVRIADGRPPNECRSIGEYWEEGPIWSPDGRYLAYRHTDCDGPRDEWWDVVISDRKGNVVTSFPSEGWQIAWSPDSSRVAVWVRWHKTIGVYGLDGMPQTLLTVPPGMMEAGDFDPVWAPDGQSLLVPFDVVIPISGGAAHRLPMTDQQAAWLTYSPDGSRVAYTTRQSLVVAATDGSEAHDVFGDYAFRPVWSPTGDRIAFDSAHVTELRVLEVATGTVTLLAKQHGSDVLDAIDFSPNGNRILFARTKDKGSGESALWSIKSDGSDLRRLVAGTFWGDWATVH